MLIFSNNDGKRKNGNNNSVFILNALNREKQLFMSIYDVQRLLFCSCEKYFQDEFFLGHTYWRKLMISLNPVGMIQIFQNFIERIYCHLNESGKHVHVQWQSKIVLFFCLSYFVETSFVYVKLLLYVDGSYKRYCTL